MILGVAILGCSALIVLAFHYSKRLAGDAHADIGRWFWSWLGRGLLVPVLMWTLWNVGIVPGLPAIMPQIARVQSGGGNYLAAFAEVFGLGLLVISSYWAAVTFGWFFAFVAQRKDIRSDFLGGCVVWSILMGPIALFVIYVSGWAGAGFAVVAWLWPILNSSLPLLARKQLGPLYSRAVGKLKMGKYEDAEWDILQELEKCEDDFEGWLMLADLYGNQFGDLAGAERTIHDICNHPTATPSQISIALHRLADWHLKLSQDPVAARSDLEEIRRRLPGTHLATMAGHRINRLPRTREELEQQLKGKTIRLSVPGEPLPEIGARTASEMSREQALGKADEYVNQLKQDPDCISAREHLARLFADRLEHPELAIEQVELLLSIPEQPPEKKAQWLGLIASWELQYRQDPISAQQILQRIVREYPQTTHAFAAQRRLKLMEMEMKLRKNTHLPARL